MMNPEPNPQAIDQYEQTILNGLNTLDGRIRARINALCCPPAPTSSQGLLRDLDGELGPLHQFTPCAVYLTNAGRPQADHRLAAMVEDLKKAITIYAEMYKESVAHLQSLSRAQWQASQDWANAVQGATQRQQETFTRGFNQRQADFNRCCVHCNYSLGDLYYTLTICPACKLLLRPPVAGF